MLGINCLVNNPELKPELTDIVVSKGWELATETGKPPSIGQLFKSLRKDGIEIDIQTLSYLYSDAFSHYPGFTDDTELAEARSQTYRDLIKAEAELMKVKEIGKDSPVTAVVAKLMEQVKLIGEQSTTVQRLFQDRLEKAAKRVTGFKSEKAGANKTGAQILQEVLSLEQNNKFGPGFSAMENARKLWDEFRKEFNEMADVLEEKDDVYNAEKLRQYADILEEATYKFLMSTAEVQTVIKDVLTESGYTKDVNGKKVVDWNKVFADTDIDFTKLIKDVFREKGFTEDQLDRIADEMKDEWDKVKAAKMENALNQRNKTRNKTAKKSTAIQQLQNLYGLGIFNAANQQALFKVLGVNGVTASRINQLQQLMALNNRAMQQPMSSWSHTYLKSIQREIEIIIERSEENKDFLLKAIRKWSFFNQINNALLLSNPQNFTENVLSGAFQTFMTTLLTQPKEAVKSFNILWNVWKDVAKGGVREGHEMANTFNSSGNLEDIYNFETANTASEKITALLAWLPRAALSTFDNGFKAHIIHQIGIDVIKKEMKRQGATAAEANVMVNEIFYGNKKEIEELAKQYVANLQASGVKASDSKWKRIAAELAWGNLMSDGKFFQDTMEVLISKGEVRDGLNINFDKQFLKQIYNAAEAAASKGLGHQADNKVFELITDRWAKMFGQNVSEARRKGSGLAGAEGARSLFGQANKFVFGGLRWAWLTAEKTSGLALLQTLLTDVALSKKESGKLNRYSGINIDIDENDATALDNRGKQLEWYASLKQRLIRQTVSPIFGYIAFSMISSLFKNGDDDDDKESALYELAIEIQKDRNKARWAQKTLPPIVYNYLTSIAWIDAYGKPQHIKRSDVKIPKEINAAEFIFSARNLLETYKNNINEANLGRLLGEIRNMGDRKEGALEKFGGILFGSMFTSPLKIADIYQKAFESRPLKTKSEYEKLKPDSFIESVLKESVTEDMWREHENVKKRK